MTRGGGRIGSMSYIVDRISNNLRIDPDAGGQEQRRKREKPGHKADQADSVSISDEAKKLLQEAEVGETPEA